MSERKRQPNAQELTQAFLHATTKFDGHILNLEDDLLFNLNDQLFYYYARNHWKPLNDASPTRGIEHLIATTLIRDFPDVSATRAKRADVLSLAKTLIPRLYASHKPSYVTAFDDKLFDWTTMSFTPLDRSAYAFHAYAFPAEQLNAPTPVFDAYLNTCFPGDQDTQIMIIEMMGYYLSPSPQPYIFFLYGEPATGKSVFLDLMHLLIGRQFTSSIHLEPLTRDKFSIIGLANKKVNIVDEDESDYINAGKLKSLASHSPTEAQYKFGQAFKFTPHAKLLFASNQFPKFKDVDGGTKRRLFFIHYLHTVPAHLQDPDLIHKLQAELPGITGKALRAAQTFYANNQAFTPSKASQEAKQLFLDHALPEVEFFRDRYIVPNPDGLSTMTQTIYQAYRTWCQDVGKQPKNKQNFSRIINENFPALTTKVTREGKRWNVVMTSNI